MKKVVLLCMLVFGLETYAQEKTKVRFYVKGGEQIYLKVDNDEVTSSNKMMLDQGTHNLEIWSPTYKLAKDALMIEGKDSITYVKKLKQDSEYITYLNQKDIYNKRIFWYRTLPLATAGLGAILTPVLYLVRRPLHEDYIQQRFLWERGGNPESNFRNVESSYNLTNGFFYAGAGMFVVGIAAHFALKPLVKSTPKPVYRQQNPFTLEYYELSLLPGATGMGLQLTF